MRPDKAREGFVNSQPSQTDFSTNAESCRSKMPSGSGIATLLLILPKMGCCSTRTFAWRSSKTSRCARFLTYSLPCQEVCAILSFMPRIAQHRCTFCARTLVSREQSWSYRKDPRCCTHYNIFQPWTWTKSLRRLTQPLHAHFAGDMFCLARGRVRWCLESSFHQK